MKSSLLGAAFAAASYVVAMGSANAVTFNVTGSNVLGQTVTGTIDGDAGLTTLNAINLVIPAMSGSPFNVIDDYTGNQLAADTTPSGNHDAFISFFFSSSDTDAYINTLLTTYAGLQAFYTSQHSAALFACVDPAHQPAAPGCGTDADATFAAQLAALDVLRQTNFGATVVAQVETTPLPAALPLFASGAGLLGFLGWRRKRKVAHKENAV